MVHHTFTVLPRTEQIAFATNSYILRMTPDVQNFQHGVNFVFVRRCLASRIDRGHGRSSLACIWQGDSKLQSVKEICHLLPANGNPFLPQSAFSKLKLRKVSAQPS